MVVYAGKRKLPKGDFTDILEGSGTHMGPPRIYAPAAGGTLASIGPWLQNITQRGVNLANRGLTGLQNVAQLQYLIPLLLYRVAILKYQFEHPLLDVALSYPSLVGGLEHAVGYP